LTKKHLLNYGKVPPKQMPEQLAPWHTLCIDLIGPYAIGKDVTRQTTKNKIVSVKVVQKAPILWCMTMINPATNWFEIVQITDKTSKERASKLEITWFNRYPLPTEIIVDRGKEFMGEVISMLRDDYNIKPKVVTTMNPASARAEHLEALDGTNH